jgi:hypothetical protein
MILHAFANPAGGMQSRSHLCLSVPRVDLGWVDPEGGGIEIKWFGGAGFSQRLSQSVEDAGEVALVAGR